MGGSVCLCIIASSHVSVSVAPPEKEAVGAARRGVLYPISGEMPNGWGGAESSWCISGLLVSSACVAGTNTICLIKGHEL